MTLCIAAACEHGSKTTIVCCSDMLSSNTLVKTDDSVKHREEGSFNLMMAGHSGYAIELMAMMTPHLRKFDTDEKRSSNSDHDLRVSQLMQGLREVCRARKEALIRHELSMKHAMTLEWFRDYGREKLTPEFYADLVFSVQNMNLNCAILISSVEDTEDTIVSIDDTGHVAWRENYACIGSGSTIAEAILAQNNWDSTMSLGECLVRVYGAMVAARKDPFVGEKALFTILLKNQGQYTLTTAGEAYLDSIVPKYQIPTSIKFPPKSWTRWG